MEVNHTNCDGKKYGEGIKIKGSNKYLCNHNNLLAKYPNLAEEWSEKNFPLNPEDFLPGSCKKVWWKCKNNNCGCHVWEAKINERTKSKGTGCPFCTNQKVCEHNNLEITFPILKKEWHPDNRPMDTFLPFSNCKVKWICSENPCGCHIWETSINNRTSNGTGCPYCSNQKICDHNNLEVSFPELKKEWHPDNKPMSTYFSQSCIKVKWICTKNPCGCHVWETFISDRTKNGSGCPYCSGRVACDHNNLEISFPDLKREWHPENKPMKTYLPLSNLKVKWICPNNKCGCHVWDAVVSSRTRFLNSGCPYCAGKKFCDHNNLKNSFPELIKEWHPENKPMDSFLPHSQTKVKWICSLSLCRCHVWTASINSRTRSNGTDCPYCANQKLCKHNNLEITFPELKKEWHPENKPMYTFSPHSKSKVKWICSKNLCGCHIWDAYIYDRTGNYNHGCPFCGNRKLCPHNNLEAKHPELIEEWHQDNEKSMEKYSPGSDYKAIWVCSEKPKHIWKATICSRTGPRKQGCPHCAKSRQYSICALEWLESIEEKENIKIQHARWTEGEYRISSGHKVDGYCKETNTVYEYESAYWHGHPSVYKPNDINPSNKKTFGELYEKTTKKETLIKSLGYNLVIKWDIDKENV